MIEKIKKIKFLPLIFLFALAGIFLPLQPALALSWLPKLIASAIITLIFGVFILLSVAFFALAEWLLRFVLSPDFISVPYTTNAFVELGWSLTRDFVNMFFIIILVIIGLGTALRLGEYQWQKTLPRLILIALLINFTPVILGLIIDASNIVMNFFVSGISSENIFSSQYDLYTSRMFSITEEPGWLEILLMPSIFIVSNFITGVIYLAFAALFIMRYVALWLLIILSPIAFICYILPNTKGIWNMWWNQFTQWCIIGISAAFFLYLSDQLLYYFLINPGMMADPDREGWGLLNAIIPYWVVLAFLIFGLFSALSTSAIGAGGIISFAQRQTRAAPEAARKFTSWTGKKTSQVARGIPGISQTGERIRRRMEGMPVISRIPGAQPGTVDKKKQAEMDSARKSLSAIPDTPEGNKALSRIVEQKAITKEAQQKRAAALEALAERKELKDHHKRFLSSAQTDGANIKAILSARPDFAGEFKDPSGASMTTQDAMNKITPGDFWRGVQKDALLNPQVVAEGALDERKFEQMSRHMRVDLKREYKNTLENHTSLSRRALLRQGYTRDQVRSIENKSRRLSTDPRWQV